MSGSFESVQWTAFVLRLDLGLYSHPKEFFFFFFFFFFLEGGREGERIKTHVNSKGEKPLYQELRGGSNPRRCITQDGEPNTLPTELIRPQLLVFYARPPGTDISRRTLRGSWKLFS